MFPSTLVPQQQVLFLALVFLPVAELVLLRALVNFILGNFCHCLVL
jgi:hypothetical protein